MYFQGVLTIDPSQLTHLDRVKPTKGFARMAHLLTGGLVSSKEERETFCAVTILQQINVVIRSVGIDNIVRLAKDGTVFYEDTRGEKGDLKRALDQFSARAESVDVRSFNTLHLVLEHHTNSLACLLDIRILRTHAVGEHPITITVNGLPTDLSAEGGEDHVRRELKSVFATQSSYDAFVARHKQAFETLLEQLRAAFKTHMRIDDLHLSSCVKIIRPSKRITRRSDIPPATGDYYEYDPVYHDGYGFGDAFFFAWLWSESCHSNDIHCHECTIVDSTGAEVLEVGTEGFQAGENNTMNVDEPFNLPEGTDIQIVAGSEYTAEIANDSQRHFDVLGTGTESGGWLSSLGESLGDAWDGGSSCGGSSCGGGCGGE